MGKDTEYICILIDIGEKNKPFQFSVFFPLSIGNLGHDHVSFVIAEHVDAKHVQDEDLLTG